MQAVQHISCSTVLLRQHIVLKAVQFKVYADNFQINQISVYPNPSKDVFYVKLNNNTPFDIRVTDITGKVVYTKKQMNATTPFPLQMGTYSSGIYFLQIRANNQLTTRKLVLN